MSPPYLNDYFIEKGLKTEDILSCCLHERLPLSAESIQMLQRFLNNESPGLLPLTKRVDGVSHLPQVSDGPILVTGHTLAQVVDLSIRVAQLALQCLDRAPQTRDIAFNRHKKSPVAKRRTATRGKRKGGK